MRDLQNVRNPGALPLAGWLPVKAAQRRVRAFWRITLRAGSWRAAQRRCGSSPCSSNGLVAAPSWAARQGPAHARAKRYQALVPVDQCKDTRLPLDSVDRQRLVGTFVEL